VGGGKHFFPTASQQNLSCWMNAASATEWSTCTTAPGREATRGQRRAEVICESGALNGPRIPTVLPIAGRSGVRSALRPRGILG
jgi:hypothetical protein